MLMRRTELSLTTKLSAEHETPPIANVLLCVRLLFIVHFKYSCVVAKLSVFEFFFNYFFCNVKVNDNTTSFHCPTSNTSTVCVSKPCPTQNFVQLSFKSVSFVKVLFCPEAVNFIFYF